MKTLQEQEIADLEKYIKDKDEQQKEYLKSIPITKNYILKLWLKKQMDRGFSPIVCVTGHTRIGKTCLALTLAEGLDDTFNFKEQYFYKLKDFANLLFKGDLKKKIVIFDEAGYQFDNLKWWNYLNIILSHILQTQALKNTCYFFVLPKFNYISKKIRQQIDVKIKVLQRGFCKVYFILDTDMFDDRKVYMKYIEMLANVPLPKCFDEFKEFEKTFKQDILGNMITDMELGELKENMKREKYKNFGLKQQENELSENEQLFKEL